MVTTTTYQTSTDMSPMDKIAQQSGITSGLNQAVQGISDGISSLLTSAGLSSGGVGSSAANAVDGIVGGGDANYTTGAATNRATSTGLRDMRGGSSPDRPTGQKYSVQISPQGRINSKTMREADNLDIFPPDVGKYYIRFDFMDYERPAPFTPATVQSEYAVVLPVPAGLVEYYDNKWETPELALIGDIADAFTRNTPSDGSLAGSFGAGARNVAYRALGNANEAAGVAVGQLSGAVPNPNVTAAFKGPNLRQFSFAWTFAPKTPDESRKIQKIVKGIKKRILPVMNEGSTSLLGYPSMVQPRLYPNVDGGGDPLFEFKKCVIPRMNVSYSPTGIPSFFKGTNLPTFVQLAITLVEIEYFTETGDSVSDESIAAYSNNVVGTSNKQSEPGT